VQLVIEPREGTVERWAWDYVRATSLADKTAPAPVPDRWDEPRAPVRIESPGRPAELRVVRKAKKTRGLMGEEGRARALHSFWHHELQAAELMAWAVLAFPETPIAFREGLVRSGAWSSHIAEVFANQGLPAELAVLPHVESSFNPAAYSKVGAAGLWQFMRSTGRRYMRIDAAIDDRMDPFRSTEAAAQLLAYNYRLLGTWPLALTAYNHGAAGMRRAKESVGTDDIERIVRTYKSPSFGFASRNFYVSFLAALEVDHNPDKYFKDLEPLPEVKFAEISTPSFVPISSLERTLKTVSAGRTKLQGNPLSGEVPVVTPDEDDESAQAFFDQDQS